MAKGNTGSLAGILGNEAAAGTSSGMVNVFSSCLLVPKKHFTVTENLQVQEGHHTDVFLRIEDIDQGTTNSQIGDESGQRKDTKGAVHTTDIQTGRNSVKAAKNRLSMVYKFFWGWRHLS